MKNILLKNHLVNTIFNLLLEILLTKQPSVLALLNIICTLQYSIMIKDLNSEARHPSFESQLHLYNGFCDMQLRYRFRTKGFFFPAVRSVDSSPLSRNCLPLKRATSPRVPTTFQPLSHPNSGKLCRAIFAPECPMGLTETFVETTSHPNFSFCPILLPSLSAEC